ncbi:MAG: hypothetical protein WC360_02450 [Opitutales bacterium]|jgi:hypothetical protein
MLETNYECEDLKASRSYRAILACQQDNIEGTFTSDRHEGNRLPVPEQGYALEGENAGFKPLELELME